ncbi:MAG TPA: NAD(P)-dependent oxidoreductase, partial [Casimicrobiaceae bacterium]
MSDKLRVAFGGRIARKELIAALSPMPEIAFTAAGDLTELGPLVSGNDVLMISDPRGTEGNVLAEALRSPGSSVRWIQCVSAGVDGLLSHGIPPSIRITNQGGAVAPTVAEHAIGLMLMMTRQLGPIYDRSHRGTWDRDFTPPIVAVEGRTLAIIGYGNIGRNIARRAHAFDMHVVGLARTPRADEFADEMLPLTHLHATLGRADIVAVCVALGASTRHLIDAAALGA